MKERLEIQLRNQCSQLMKKWLRLKETIKKLTEKNQKRRRALFIYTKFKKYVRENDRKLYENAFKYINKKYPKHGN